MNPRPLLLILTLSLPLVLAARADGALPEGPTEAQATTAKLVQGVLSDSRYAYRPRPLDDALQPISATGSAGTHAGLVAGLAMIGADIPILGIGVRAPKETQEANVHKLAVETAAR